MISIYTSAFNLIKNKFDYKFHIQKFSQFANEVVIAINNSEDDTLEKLILYSKQFNNVKIIPVDISYNDPLLDGKIKNIALQSTTEEIKINLDMDEYIPLWQKPIWYNLATQLKYNNYNCFMIPSINLFKDKDSYFSITSKWYLHKSGLFRGPVNFAQKSDGTIDTSKSDSCELIDKKGNLVSSQLTPSDIKELRKNIYPFVVHNGYLNLQDRLLRNKNFWKKHWKMESGGTDPKHKVHESLEDFNENYYQHNLNI